MAEHKGLARRAFLRSAGLTALAGTVGSAVGAAAPLVGAAAAADGPFDFDTVQNRIGTDSTKWDQQIRLYGRDHVDVGMGIADMDFKPAPCIRRALLERIERDNWGYITMPESHVESIVSWNRRRYGLEINPAWVVHSPALHPALIATLRAFSPPGTRVLMPCPSYSGFYSDIRTVGCKPADVPFTLTDGRYQMNLELLERTISHDTHSLILCNPQNPTGNVWSKADLLALGEICLRRRVVVLADEVHCDFVNGGHTYTPFATLPNEAVVRNSITFKSASKSFNLIGMKCAYFFSSNPEYLARIKPWHRDEITTLGMVAHRAAYTEGDAWLDALRAYNDANLTFVDEYIRRNIPLISMVKPQGTYLAWLDVSKVVEKVGARALADQANQKRDPALAPLTPSHMMEKWFVEHAHVQMNPGGGFGTGGAERMRMNCATSRKVLELALGNLASALRGV
ncbi:MAG TPA: aminotransferase class I/II-fold pyridoxal phosphate-dependent enzyme [Vicinamibacterales bacterium]|nr:aminotransferase class I/II-fold pyridoxal phosphate-dependent enzyme [Vicinamibacterales bacterium]